MFIGTNRKLNEDKTEVDLTFEGQTLVEDV